MSAVKNSPAKNNLFHNINRSTNAHVPVDPGTKPTNKHELLTFPGSSRSKSRAIKWKKRESLPKVRSIVPYATMNDEAKHDIINLQRIIDEIKRSSFVENH